MFSVRSTSRPVTLSKAFSTFKPVNRPSRYVVVHQDVDSHSSEDFAAEHRELHRTYLCDRESNSIKQDQKPAKLAQMTANLASKLSSTDAMTESLRGLGMRTAAHLLPKDFPHSVGPAYLPYAQWSMLAGVAGTVSGVLSMQSLLFAMGLSSGSVPLAAALNWIIKDGLGQLGGVVYASTIHHRFDSDTKRWRFTAAMVYDASIVVEVLTPLFPAYFLPLASAANVGKNVGWLSASATRAAIHKSLSLRGNLADVTAKAGSQTIAASVAGTALGVMVSPVIGTDPYAVLGATLCCISLHLGCSYKSLCGVVLPSLNLQRGWLALRDVVSVTDDNNVLLDWNKIKTPSHVQPFERFVHMGRWGGPMGRIVLEDTEDAMHGIRLEIGPPVSKFSSSLKDFEEALNNAEEFQDKHLIRIKRTKSANRIGRIVPWLQSPLYSIQLLIIRDASEEQVAQGILHAFVTANRLKKTGVLQSSTSDAPLLQVSQQARDMFVIETRRLMSKAPGSELDILKQLELNGWDTTYINWEERKSRIWLAEAQVWPPEQVEQTSLEEQIVK